MDTDSVIVKVIPRNKAVVPDPSLMRIATVPKCGGRVWLGRDGEWWRKTSGFAEATVPVRSIEELQALTGLALVEKVKPALNKVDWSWMPPLPQIGWLREQLLERGQGREVMVVLMRTRGTPHRWSAAVPKQTTTIASFDAPELKSLFVRWIRAGWEPTGTLHTHPGDMITSSSVDDKAWRDMPGIHLIVAQTADEVGVYVMVAGELFLCQPQQIPAERAEMVVCTPTGGKRWWRNLAKPKPVVLIPSRSCFDDYYGFDGYYDADSGRWLARSLGARSVELAHSGVPSTLACRKTVTTRRIDARNEPECAVMEKLKRAVLCDGEWYCVFPKSALRQVVGDTRGGGILVCG